MTNYLTNFKTPIATFNGSLKPRLSLNMYDIDEFKEFNELQDPPKTHLYLILDDVVVDDKHLDLFYKQHYNDLSKLNFSYLLKDNRNNKIVFSPEDENFYTEFENKWIHNNIFKNAIEAIQNRTGEHFFENSNNILFPSNSIYHVHAKFEQIFKNKDFSKEDWKQFLFSETISHQNYQIRQVAAEYIKEIYGLYLYCTDKNEQNKPTESLKELFDLFFHPYFSDNYDEVSVWNGYILYTLAKHGTDEIRRQLVDYLFDLKLVLHFFGYVGLAKYGTPELRKIILDKFNFENDKENFLIAIAQFGTELEQWEVLFKPTLKDRMESMWRQYSKLIQYGTEGMRIEIYNNIINLSNIDEIKNRLFEKLAIYFQSDMKDYFIGIFYNNADIMAKIAFFGNDLHRHRLISHPDKMVKYYIAVRGTDIHRTILLESQNQEVSVLSAIAHYGTDAHREKILLNPITQSNVLIKSSMLESLDNKIKYHIFNSFNEDEYNREKALHSLFSHIKTVKSENNYPYPDLEIYADVDNFKSINESIWVKIGNKIIRYDEFKGTKNNLDEYNVVLFVEPNFKKSAEYILNNKNNLLSKDIVGLLKGKTSLTKLEEEAVDLIFTNQSFYPLLACYINILPKHIAEFFLNNQSPTSSYKQNIFIFRTLLMCSNHKNKERVINLLIQKYKDTKQSKDKFKLINEIEEFNQFKFDLESMLPAAIAIDLTIPYSNIKTIVEFAIDNEFSSHFFYNFSTCCKDDDTLKKIFDLMLARINQEENLFILISVIKNIIKHSVNKEYFINEILKHHLLSNNIDILKTLALYAPIKFTHSLFFHENPEIRAAMIDYNQPIYYDSSYENNQTVIDKLNHW